MLKDKRNETNESGKMLALSLALTNVLLLAVVAGVFWLAQTVLTESRQLHILTRGFSQL